MEQKLINILRALTSKDDPFIPLGELLNKAYQVTEFEKESGEIQFVNEFEQSIIDLLNKDIVRVTQDLNVALEESIECILNERKSSAIQEMEEELQKAIEDEDYEKASEYRDMIGEFKSKDIE